MKASNFSVFVKSFLFIPNLFRKVILYFLKENLNLKKIKLLLIVLSFGGSVQQRHWETDHQDHQDDADVDQKKNNISFSHISR